MSTHLEAMNATALQKRLALALANGHPDFVPENASRSALSDPILRRGPCWRISPPAEREESIER
jgi:hypothetical protein